MSNTTTTTDPSTFLCGFCDDFAIGLVPAPWGPWAFCDNHKSAAHAEARADREMATCDECGQVTGGDEAQAHAEHCSLHPANEVTR